MELHDLPLLFLTGFFSSVHCIGMCGALVIGYTGAQPVRSGSRWAAHLGYTTGRIGSYALLGLASGAAGSRLAQLQSYGSTLSVLLGMLMLAAAAGTTGWTGRLLTGRLRLPLVGRLTAVTRRLVSMPGAESAFYLGVLTPFLPCGLLYAMVIKAADAGSALAGALNMVAFGLGMAPALLLTGLFVQYLGPRLRRAGMLITALSFAVMGLAMIARGLGLPFPWMEYLH